MYFSYFSFFLIFCINFILKSKSLSFTFNLQRSPINHQPVGNEPPKNFWKLQHIANIFHVLTQQRAPTTAKPATTYNLRASGFRLQSSGFNRNYTHRSRNLKAIKANIIAHKSVTDVNVKETLRRVSHRAEARPRKQAKADRSRQSQAY